MKEQEKEKNKKRGIVVIAVIIIAVLVGVIIYLLLSQNTKSEDEKRNVIITPENVESVLKELDEAQQPGYYTVTMNPTWHFESGGEVSYDAVVKNVEKNTNDVYFDIVLESDEERVLYKSPVIPRGGRLEQIALDEKLETGTYNCVVIFHLVDEEQITISTVRVALKIIVEG